MSTEQPLSTTQLLTLILTELRSIKVALQPKGSSQPPARQPAPNQNSGGQSYSDGNQYAKREDEKFSTCNRCGAANVIWRKSKAGKSYLVNPDGAYHSSTCNK